jgi:hypothetical protein
MFSIRRLDVDWKSVQQAITKRGTRFNLTVKTARRERFMSAEASDRTRAERLAYRKMRNQSVTQVFIRDRGRNFNYQTPAKLVAFMIRGTEQVHFIDTEKGTVDGEPGLVLSIFRDPTKLLSAPDDFAVVAGTADAAIELAREILESEACKDFGVVMISTAKGFDPKAPFLQGHPVKRHQALQFTVGRDPHGKIEVVDDVAAFKAQREDQLRNELTALQNWDGAVLR